VSILIPLIPKYSLFPYTTLFRSNMEESAGEVEDESIPSMIVSMIPSNIFEDLSQSRDTSVISVVIFSIITGIAFMGVKRKQPDQAEKFASGVEAVFSI